MHLVAVRSIAQVLESADWSCGNNQSNLNSIKSVFLDGSFAFWSSVAVLDSVPSSDTKMLNFLTNSAEGMVDFTIIFSLEEFEGTIFKVHEKSIFGSSLNGFGTVFLDSSVARGIRVAPSDSMPGIDTKILPVDFVEFGGDIVLSMVEKVSDS